MVRLQETHSHRETSELRLFWVEHQELILKLYQLQCKLLNGSRTPQGEAELPLGRARLRPSSAPASDVAAGGVWHQSSLDNSWLDSSCNGTQGPKGF